MKLEPIRLIALACKAGAMTVSVHRLSRLNMAASARAIPVPSSSPPRSAQRPPSQLPSDNPARITPMIEVQL